MITVEKRYLDWLMQELAAAGIRAKKSPCVGRLWNVTVSQSDYPAACAIAQELPAQDYSDHPLIAQKKRRNFIQGGLQFFVVGGAALALMAMSLMGVAPGLLTGVAVYGAPVVIATGIGIPVILFATWVYMVRVRTKAGSGGNE